MIGVLRLGWGLRAWSRGLGPDLAIRQGGLFALLAGGLLFLSPRE